MTATQTPPTATTPQQALSEPFAVEVSVVMPCLNEADTLGACIARARRALDDNRIVGEIIVADNGSDDASRQIAVASGARLISVEEKGYGCALMGGIAAARGRYIIMGDADQSYDFGEIPRFVGKLREGFDLVQGCRLPAGGGTVQPGAMPFLHRWWGNPGFSFIARWWFGAPINDVYCGLRGFTRSLYDRLGQRCKGMEFATEMIIRSSRYGAKMTEVPITLHPDGRKSHPPHLKTFRDGWRTLRFFLMYSPKWLFLQPGKILIVLGLLGYVLALPGLTIGGVHFSSHSLLVASLAILCGYQSILFAIGVKTFAMSQGFLPPDSRIQRLFNAVSLERGLFVGIIMMIVGVALIIVAANNWRLAGFGNLDYEQTMRWVIPGATMTAIGFQTILSSFFITILSIFRQ
jgi:hypothetical protein